MPRIIPKILQRYLVDRLEENHEKAGFLVSRSRDAGMDIDVTAYKLTFTRGHDRGVTERGAARSAALFVHALGAAREASLDI